MVPLSLEETIPPGHHVRVLWAVVERLDLSKLTEGLKVSEGQAGRSATDVRLLVALWLYAATQGVGSARSWSGCASIMRRIAGCAAGLA